MEKDAGVSINGTGSLRQTPEKAVQEDPKDGDIDEHNRYAPQDTDDGKSPFFKVGYIPFTSTNTAVFMGMVLFQMNLPKKNSFNILILLF